MIATAIGIPKPSAPKIAGTNSDSRRTPDDDMTLLLGAPRASARPQDERSIAPSDYGPRRLSVKRQCWGVMVNRWLIDKKKFADRALTRRLTVNRVQALLSRFGKFRKSASPASLAALHLVPHAVREWRPFDATPFSGARADQNEQP